MRLEFAGATVAVSCFSDLVVTTDSNELLYASIKGYDSAVQALRAAANSKKSESFYLYATDDCLNMFGSRAYQFIQVIGSFKSFMSKEEDLTQAELVSRHIIEESTTPVLMAWDGDVLKAFTQAIKRSHPYPVMDEWMDYLYSNLRSRGKVERCKVYTTSENDLEVCRITATAEDIENIIIDGIRFRDITMPEGPEGDVPVDSCQTMTDYLGGFGKALAINLGNIFKPRHIPGEPIDESIYKLLRKLFQAQADVTTGFIRTLKKRRTGLIVGEMGCGKTTVGNAIANGLGAKEILVMCPGHLTKKWKREIEDTVPGADVFFINGYTDVFRVKDIMEQSADHPRFYVVSKDTAKLSYFKRRAVRWSSRREGWICPDCGALQTYEVGPKGEKESYPLLYEEFDVENAKTSKCCACGTKLWAADNQFTRRVAPADLIKKYLKGRFDLFICDEIHQMKGDSAQGNAFGAFVDVAKKTLGLTGTLLGGYASNLFRILFRLNPQAFLAKGMDFHSVSKFVSQYGVLEKVFKEKDGAKNKSSNGKQTSVSVRERPGISPKVFGEFLLDSCAFLELSDVSDMLPEYKECVRLIGMDGDLQFAYEEVEKVLKALFDEQSMWGNNSLLGTYINNLLSYPDKPFDNPDILKPGTDDEVIITPPELDKDVLYAKEEHLIQILKEEKRQGRKCLVFASFTGKKKDVTGRLDEIIKKAGFKVAVLKSSVKPDKREEWLADKVYRGVDVVIANPTLVETGLDCLDFPTIIYHQTGYNLFTIRQSSRRSFRIGQKKDVKVYFLIYEKTLQDAAIRLMGQKMEASLAIEGRFSEEGLRMMGSGSGDDMGTALAKALVKGLEGIDSAEAIWGRMGYGTIEAPAEETRAEITCAPITTGIIGTGTVGIIEVMRVAGKKKEKTTQVAQLGWDFDFAQEA